MIVLKETIGFGEFLYITIWKMTAFAKKTRSRKPYLLMLVFDFIVKRGKYKKESSFIQKTKFIKNHFIWKKI